MTTQRSENRIDADVNMARPMTIAKRETLGKTQEGLREETRGLILSASKQLFSEIGYAGSSMQLIAARAGISRSSLYRHFDTKWSVAKALIDTFLPTWVDLWKTCPIDNDATTARLLGWLKIMLTEQRRSKGMILLMQEIMSIEDEAGELNILILDQILKIVGNECGVFLSNTLNNDELYFFDQLFIIQINYFFYTSLRSSCYGQNTETSLNAMARHMRGFVEARRAMLEDR